MIEDLYFKFRDPLTYSSNNKYKTVLGTYDPTNNYIVLNEMISQNFKFMFMPLTYQFYNSLKSVALIDFGENDVKLINAPDKVLLLSYATFLHETYHSWQSYGTTLGFMNIMGIAAQGALGGILREVTNNDLVKPLYIQENNPQIYHMVNTFFDIEFGSALLFYPNKRMEIFKSPFYVSTGHSCRYLFQEALKLIDSTLKFENDIISYYDEWEHEFQRLNDNKVDLYFNKSPMLKSDFGACEILEGQARFQELQYLYSMDSEFFNWDIFEEFKFLEEPYSTVFNYYIKYLDINFPTTPISKEVNLFLLICDIALTPDVGYPNRICDYKNFVRDINPYCRFINCMNIIKLNMSILNYVEDISFESYIYVSEFITKELNYVNLRDCYKKIISTSNSIEIVSELKLKYQEFSYNSKNSNNILVEYYYMHHLNVIENKYMYPEFFCWTGQFITGKFNKYSDQKIQEIMNNVSPPFISLGMDEKINLYSIHESKKGHNEFASYFFNYQTFNDLIRQLITKPGEFQYNYAWNKYDNDNEFMTYFKEKFKLNTNRAFEDFTFL